MSKKFIYVNANGLYEETAGAFEVADHVSSSAGAGDSGKPVVLNSDGKIDSTMIPFSAFDWKESVRLVSTADVALTGGATLTIDGVAVANGDRILLRNQTTGSENGIYVASGIGSSYVLTRSSDADVTGDITSGLTVAAEEGTLGADKIFMLTTNNPIVVGTTSLSFQIVPVNSFTGGLGITISGGNVIDVDLLNADSGLFFAGVGSDELAIQWASTYTIDSADALAFKASKLASTATGNGAAIVGIEDASAYYTANNLEGVLNELEAQIGGATSSTYNFSENNVLADNDPIYSALNKLDLKWGDLASTASGEGASLVGIFDAGGYYSAINVENALQEVAKASLGVEYTAGLGGVTKGDLVYISANDTVLPYSTLTTARFGIGLAYSTASAGNQVIVAEDDVVLTGVLSGATAGNIYYWDGSALTTTIPSGAGAYVWRVGVAKNATDLHVEVSQIKRNS